MALFSESLSREGREMTVVPGHVHEAEAVAAENRGLAELLPLQGPIAAFAFLESIAGA